MKSKLTERKIRGLAATGAPVEILHDRTPSAGLRISSQGAKIWFYIYRSPVVRDARGQAKQRRVYLGYHPSGRWPDRPTEGKHLPLMSLEQFENAYHAFRGELGKGIDPQAVVGVTLAETARWIGPESLPESLRPLYPEGFREGTFAALLVDYFRYHAAVNLKARTSASYRHAAKST